MFPHVSTGACALRRFPVCALILAFACVAYAPTARAAIGTAGDVTPVPPTLGGSVVGPFRIGNTGVGAMTVAENIVLTNTNATLIGDASAAIGLAVVDNSTWNMTTLGADLTVGNNGSGSLRLVNFGVMTVSDSLILAAQPNALGDLSVTGFGTIFRATGNAMVADRGQAVVTVQDGGRVLSGVNIVGNEFSSDGRVTLRGQFSLWRSTASLIVANAGHGVVQVLDGARFEDTTGTIGSVAGSNGAVEVAGLGSLWQNSQSIVVGDTGFGTLLIRDSGYVTTNAGAVLSTIGRQAGSIGRVEVRNLDSLLSVSLLTVGASGDGTLRVLDSGHVRSANVILGDTATGRGVAVVAGDGSTWEINGDLAISDPGEARLEISNGGLVHTTAQARVGALGRLALDGGRLAIDSPAILANNGVVEGNGTIASALSNNAGSQLRPHGQDPLIINGALTNAGLVDVAAGQLEVLGATVNNADIDARNGAVLRFRGAGLDNNTGAQLAITNGEVNIFGAVDNNAGAEIAVGSTGVAVFHDTVANSGTIFVQPEGRILMLEDLSFAPSAVLSLPLVAQATGTLEVAGAAQLGGQLQIDAVGGTAPLPGDHFTILASGGLNGSTFAAVSDNNPTLQFFPVYSATDVTVFTTATGESTWGVDAGGVVSAGANWFGGVAPTGANQPIAFSTVITADRTIQVDAPLSVSRLRFEDDNNYTLAGPQTITLAAPGSDPAAIQVDNTHGNGAHTIGAALLLADDLAVVQNSTSPLVVNGQLLNGDGRTITKSGAGALTIAGPQNHGAGARLVVSAGTLNMNSDAGSVALRNLTLDANSATNLGASQHLAALHVGEGVTVSMTTGAAKNVVAGSIAIAGSGATAGKLDVADQAVIVDYPAAGPDPQTAIRQHIISGRGATGLGATWAGTGITSSAAAADVATSPESRSVGYANNAELPLGAYSTFRGESVDGSSVLIRYTRTGDANLDGVVNDEDVTIINASYAPGVPQPFWALGDFDYNGFVDDDDVTLLSAFYNPSAPPLAALADLAAVPEPSTLGLAALGLVALLAHRRGALKRSALARRIQP
jgi:T5SS/PEP-CTERM-associated repeat protein